jgi:integrase
MSNKGKRNVVSDGIAFTGKSWSYVLRIPDSISGKTKPKWVGGFDSRESALLARDKARVALRENNYVEPTDLTTGDWLTKWITTIHRKHLKATTYDSYVKIINNHLIPGLGEIKLSKLKPSHIEQFYSDMLIKKTKQGHFLKPRVAQYAGAILKKSLKYAVEVEGLLTINPASRVALVKSNSTTPRPWSFSELKTFLEVASSHRLGFYFRLMAYTGARRGELLALKWSDFDGKAITISKSRIGITGGVIETDTTKGGEGMRRVALDTETIEQFNAHRTKQLAEAKTLLKLGAWNNTGYVFVRDDGKPLDTGTPTHLFIKLLRLSGLRHTRLHDLRHLHATELLRLGEPLHVVAKRLGHKDPMVTASIYAHVSDEQAESASTTFASGARLAN